jgi:SPX domain protein involved in polyphosphate accumulation
MKFSKQLEYHKIPEWYNNYLKYEELKESIYKFKKDITDGKCATLDGYYILTSNQSILKIDNSYSVPD